MFITLTTQNFGCIYASVSPHCFQLICYCGSKPVVSKFVSATLQTAYGCTWNDNTWVTLLLFSAIPLFINVILSSVGLIISCFMFHASRFPSHPPGQFLTRFTLGGMCSYRMSTNLYPEFTEADEKDINLYVRSWGRTPVFQSLRSEMCTYALREQRCVLAREPTANSKRLFQRPFIYGGILPTLEKVPASCSSVIYIVECLSLNTVTWSKWRKWLFLCAYISNSSFVSFPSLCLAIIIYFSCFVSFCYFLLYFLFLFYSFYFPFICIILSCAVSLFLYLKRFWRETRDDMLIQLKATEAKRREGRIFVLTVVQLRYTTA